MDEGDSSSESSDRRATDEPSSLPLDAPMGEIHELALTRLERSLRASPPLTAPPEIRHNQSRQADPSPPPAASAPNNNLNNDDDDNDDMDVEFVVDYDDDDDDDQMDVDEEPEKAVLQEPTEARTTAVPEDEQDIIDSENHNHHHHSNDADDQGDELDLSEDDGATTASAPQNAANDDSFSIIRDVEMNDEESTGTPAKEVQWSNRGVGSPEPVIAPAKATSAAAPVRRKLDLDGAVSTRSEDADNKDDVDEFAELDMADDNADVDADAEARWQAEVEHAGDFDEEIIFEQNDFDDEVDLSDNTRVHRRGRGPNDDDDDEEDDDDESKVSFNSGSGSDSQFSGAENDDDVDDIEWRKDDDDDDDDLFENNDDDHLFSSDQESLVIEDDSDASIDYHTSAAKNTNNNKKTTKTPNRGSKRRPANNASAESKKPTQHRERILDIPQLSSKLHPHLESPSKTHSHNHQADDTTSYSSDQGTPKRGGGAGGGRAGGKRTVWEAARARLTNLIAPEQGEQLVGREAQHNDIKNAVLNALRTKLGGSMFVYGVPGTGKTATVRLVMTQLVHQQQQYDFDYVEINGMKLSTPSMAYSYFWQKLLGNSDEKTNSKKKKKTPTMALSDLARHFRSATKNNQRMCILLLDEMDYLLSRDNNVIYNMMDWTQLETSRLFVIGIANTMNLPEQLSQKIRSRLGSHRVSFMPYSKDQLVAILKRRLGRYADELFSTPRVLDLIAAVEANSSGDARRTLELCRRILESLESLGRPISPADANRVMNRTQENPRAVLLRTSPFFARLLVCCVSIELKRSGNAFCLFKTALSRFKEAAKAEAVHLTAPNDTVMWRILTNLSQQRVLVVSQKNATPSVLIQLGLDEDEAIKIMTQDARTKDLLQRSGLI